MEYITPELAIIIGVIIAYMVFLTVRINRLYKRDDAIASSLLQMVDAVEMQNKAISEILAITNDLLDAQANDTKNCSEELDKISNILSAIPDVK